jgi:hypothetical protein
MKKLFAFGIGWFILCALVAISTFGLIVWLIITLIHHLGG